MITPEASRAGRALLGWSLKDLAARAGVAFTTVSQLENGRPAYPSTGGKIIAAFKAAGVDLVANSEQTGALLVYARRGGPAN